MDILNEDNPNFPCLNCKKFKNLGIKIENENKILFICSDCIGAMQGMLLFNLQIKELQRNNTGGTIYQPVQIIPYYNLL